MYILILPEWGLFTKSGLNCRIKGYMRCFSDLILLVFKDVQPEPNNIHRADGTGIIDCRFLAISPRDFKNGDGLLSRLGKKLSMFEFLFSRPKLNNSADWKSQ